MKKEKKRKKKGKSRDQKYIRNYIWIFILLIFTFIAYYFWVSNKSDFASNFLLNFGTGLLQTIIIVVLIERKMLKQEEANRRRMQIYALKSLKTEIYNQLSILFSFLSVSGTSFEELERQYKSIAELLKSSFTLGSIEKTRFCLDSCDGAIGFNNLWNVNKAFKDSIIDTLAIYSSYLDNDLMDSIDIILHNTFFNTFNDMLVYETLKNNPDHNFFLLQGQKQSIEEYINELLHIIEKYNFHHRDNKIEIDAAIQKWLDSPRSKNLF